MVQDRPAYRFLRGSIAPRARHFFPVRLTAIGLTLPFGEVTLAPEVQGVIAAHPKPENVIVGVRPEHIQDAALIDAYQRIRALTFQVKVNLVESLGADKYLYFTTESPAVHSVQLDELAEVEGESALHENQFVARVPAESKVAIGQSVELAFDTARLAVFDADSGANLTIPHRA